MSRLSIDIRTPDAPRRHRARPASTARTVAGAVAVSLGVAIGIGAESQLRGAARVVADGAMRAVAIGLPIDFAPISPEDVLVRFRGATLGRVHVDWAWDVERCERAAGADDRATVEGRAVACLLRAEPGTFCDAGYRRAFVAYARPTLSRAAEPHRRAMADRLRPALRELLRSGAVRPWDFRLWRQGGRLPHMIEAIAAEAAASGEPLPRRPC